MRSSAIRRGSEPLPVVSGTGLTAFPRGLRAPVRQQALDQPLDLSVTLQLSGTTRFAVVPAASATEVHLGSDWPHPSFGGRFLPTPGTRTVDASGFSADWMVSELATSAMADVVYGQKHLDTLDF